MKKSFFACFLCCLALWCAACSFGEQTAVPKETIPAQQDEYAADPIYDMPVKDGHYILEDEQMGLTFAIPVRQLEDKTVYYGQFALQDSPEDTPPLDGMQVFYFPVGLLDEAVEMLRDDPSEETMSKVADMIYSRSRLLYSIQYYSAGLWDGWIRSGKTIEDITGNAQNTELGRQNGRVYVYTEPAPQEQGLSDEDLAAYRLAVGYIPAMRDHAAILETKTAAAKNVFPAFAALDIYGESIDSSSFADHDLTMINIWGTFCGPCIMEMPDLGEMAAAMPPGTQLWGLVGDALNEENIELAQTIAESTGAAYPHIVPNKELYDFLRNNIVAYPTTLFIDSLGNMVGEPLVGAMSRAMYEKELDNRLQML